MLVKHFSLKPVHIASVSKKITSRSLKPMHISSGLRKTHVKKLKTHACSINISNSDATPCPWHPMNHCIGHLWVPLNHCTTACDPYYCSALCSGVLLLCPVPAVAGKPAAGQPAAGRPGLRPSGPMGHCGPQGSPGTIICARGPPEQL